MDETFYDRSRQYIGSAPKTCIDALQAYADDTPPAINYILRGMDFSGKLYPGERELFEALIKLVYNAPKVDRDMILYRGVIENEAIDYTSDFIDLGIISTSLCREEAEKFTRDGKYLLEITVPKGVRMICVDILEEITGIRLHEEGECVLPPGKFGVLDVKDNVIVCSYNELYTGESKSLETIKNFFAARRC